MSRVLVARTLSASFKAHLTWLARASSAVGRSITVHRTLDAVDVTAGEMKRSFDVDVAPNRPHRRDHGRVFIVENVHMNTFLRSRCRRRRRRCRQ